MARLYIPADLRSIALGNAAVDVEGANVGEALAFAEKRYPGLSERLLQDQRLRSGLMLVINNHVASRGLREPITGSCEIHILPALGGG